VEFAGGFPLLALEEPAIEPCISKGGISYV
jgi:hypothetical protein